MRIIRYQIQNEAPKYGWLLDNKIGEIEGDPFGAYRRAEAENASGGRKTASPVEAE